MYDYTHKSNTVLMILTFTFIFSHLADTFIQTDLQIKSTRAIICKCNDKSQLA